MLGRVVGYGYRYREVVLPLPKVKDDVQIRLVQGKRCAAVRRPVKVSLGCHIDGVALPRPDLQDRDTMTAGVCKRFATAVPKARQELLARFRSFVRTWVRKNLKPLPPDSDTTFETWLAQTPYPEWRKKELKATFDAMDDPTDKAIFLVKSFMKDEDYPEYKHGRGINSRSDEFKCLVGPIFKLIEEQVYKHPAFIKHVPVAKRPQYIKDLLMSAGVKYYATDYTSFEALFVKELMESCEFELYLYMTSMLNEFDWFKSVCEEVLAGVNECHFKEVVVRLNAVRMSGEMCTSLGNGFTNLMAMLFICTEKGSTDIRIVVEGDDGLTAINGPAPSEADFAELGLVIKLEEHLSLTTASFCGLIFDPEDLVNIADPRKILAGFGWGGGKFRHARPKILMALLRCKALSLLHQYPGAPILQELALYGLRATSDITAAKVLRAVNMRSSFDEWHRQQILQALNAALPTKRVPMNTRFLMEEKFGVTVSEQLGIEAYLRGLQTLVPLKIDIYSFPASWRHYWDVYVANDVGDHPILTVPTLGSDIYSLFTPGRGGWLVPKPAGAPAPGV